MNKAYVISSNTQVQKPVGKALAAAGFDVQVCEPAKAEHTLRKQGATLTVTDNLELARVLQPTIRETHGYLLALVPANNAALAQAALDGGADDCLPFPCDAPQLALRVAVAARNLREHITAAETFSRLSSSVASLETSRDDLLSIFDHLRMGTGITGTRGEVTFLNETAQRIFEIEGEGYRGRSWEEVFSFKPADIDLLRKTATAPPDRRKKLQLHLRTSGGRYYWIDCEIFDDPVTPQRRIFVFYDMSEMYGLRRMLDEKAEFRDLVGKSKLMHQVYQTIQEVAPVDITVSIEGETGTGKELVARAIHSSSPRKDKPFIAVNCAGLTDSLLTSQLFGHKRGAFTGAVEDHKGVFEAADGGTLFLDEIGEIPVNVQTALLRVLQQREITRVGESLPRKVNVRVITATHRNLVDEVEKGHFRADLFFRIRVARIATPALRERREDIPLLIGQFLTKNRAATGKQVEHVSTPAMRLLLDYRWPGNVRELENAIEFASLRCKGTVINVQDLPPEISHAEPAHNPAVAETNRPLDDKERMLAAIEQCSGNRKKAAQLLGMSRATFYRHLTRLGIAS